MADMLKCHWAVANEHTADATKLQLQMQALVADSAEREYAVQADFAILSSLLAVAAASRCKKCRCGCAAK